MEIRRATLETCHEATGVVVVVDVLRAFTTAAFAFVGGATEIQLVSSVEEAFGQRDAFPESLLMGEVGGLPIDGFDLPNSPTAIQSTDLTGKRLIHRTTSGTQGVVLSSRADVTFTTGLCTAQATADAVALLQPDTVTFVETGIRAGAGGEEDTACADLISNLLLGKATDLAGIRNRVTSSASAAKFIGTNHPAFPESDLAMALEIDRFDFAMRVTHEAGVLVLRPDR